MIDYIKYTVDGRTYELIKNEDGAWSKELDAPDVAGNYNLLLEISSQGIVTYIDSSDPRYDFFLNVIMSAERVVFLETYVPDFMNEIKEFETIYTIENLEFDKLMAAIEKTTLDMFISTASNESITRLENFLGIKGLGTLEQRKSYLITLSGSAEKLNEQSIKGVTNIIAGADSIVTFYASNEVNNPNQGYGLLRVQVLSPDNQKDYRYDDIQRALKPMIPAHIKLAVIKYFGTWAEALSPFESWNGIYTQVSDWQGLKDYIPDVGD